MKYTITSQEMDATMDLLKDIVRTLNVDDSMIDWNHFKMEDIDNVLKVAEENTSAVTHSINGDELEIDIDPFFVDHVITVTFGSPIVKIVRAAMSFFDLFRSSFENAANELLHFTKEFFPPKKKEEPKEEETVTKPVTSEELSRELDRLLAELTNKKDDFGPSTWGEL